MIGAPGPIDPERYCILIPNLLGNGQSTSPSNAHESQRGPEFPSVTLYDNVVLQQQMIEKCFGGGTIQLVAGWSMGGMQALQWGCLFPQQVKESPAFAPPPAVGRTTMYSLRESKPR
ncbi:alpha/beta fold hydrolase [Halopseudomonas pachastrellae]|nr:alpha/beta fold hydrolase [Halopseudomonas pachastrellae]